MRGWPCDRFTALPVSLSFANTTLSHNLARVTELRYSSCCFVIFVTADVYQSCLSMACTRLLATEQQGQWAMRSLDRYRICVQTHINDRGHTVLTHPPFPASDYFFIHTSDTDNVNKTYRLPNWFHIFFCREQIRINFDHKAVEWRRWLTDGPRLSIASHPICHPVVSSLVVSDFNIS